MRGPNGRDRFASIVDQLVDARLIEPVSSDGLRITDEFSRRIDERGKELNDLGDDELLARLTTACGEADEARALRDLDQTCDGLVEEYLVLNDLDGFTHRDRIRAMVVLSPLVSPPTSIQGVPDPFVPVDGDRLPFLVHAVERAIVYVWRDECPPCDLMKADLETVADEADLDGVALFAVYGPDSMNVLAEHYRVTGAPFTLFFLNGTVDTRLRGANYQRVIHREIEKLKERV